MSAGVQDQGKNQQSQGNAPKESRGGAVVEPEEQYDAWRTLPTHAAPSFGTMPSADPYMPGYYGNAAAYPPYPTFGVGDGGAWSNGGDHMAFMGGYGHQPDSYGMEAGMFGGGQGFGGFGQPGYGYGGFPGTGDYSAAWGTGAMGRKYDEYYRDASMYGTAAAGMAADEQRGIKQMEQGMQGLSMDAKCADEGCDGGPPGGDGPLQKKSWASIASQPAKPNSSSSKTMSPLAGGRDAIGMWDGKTGGLGPKPVIPPTMGRPGGWSAPRGRAGMPPSHPPPPQGYMPQPVSVQQPPPSLPPPPPSHPVLDDLRDRNEYNPREFDCNQKNARFFVIKSYSEDDIHRSIKYEVWCSTDHGNKRLDSAFRERDGKGPVYLLFSVNGSGHFCGMAQMVTAVDYSSSVSVWAQDKWKGQFKVRWVYVKDVPNAQLRHIRLENNENKPVTNSRDTQEVLPDKGRLVLKIMHSYNHRTSIFDDFVHYEQRQEEEESRRPCDHIAQAKEDEEVRGTGERGRGRGRRN